MEAALRARRGPARERVKSLEVKYLETPLGQVTISLGVAVFPAHGRTREDLLAAADAALYAAKAGAGTVWWLRSRSRRARSCIRGTDSVACASRRAAAAARRAQSSMANPRSR